MPFERSNSAWQPKQLFERLEALLPSFIIDEVYVFRPAKKLVVRDKALGVLQKLLFIGVVLALGLNFFWVKKTHYKVLPVQGTISELNWERLDFNAARNASFSSFPYCNNASYDYFFPTADKKKPPPHSYWVSSLFTPTHPYDCLICASPKTARMTTTWLANKRCSPIWWTQMAQAAVPL